MKVLKSRMDHFPNKTAVFDEVSEPEVPTTNKYEIKWTNVHKRKVLSLIKGITILLEVVSICIYVFHSQHDGWFD